MTEIESAFESRDNPFAWYLDTETGECIALPGDTWDDDITEEMEADIERIELAPMGRFLPLESDFDVRPSIDDAREFVQDVEDEQLRDRLTRALGAPRGAFRHFHDVLYEEIGEIERWHHFERERRRHNIAAWLAAHGLDVTYDPLPPQRPRIDARHHLLAGAVAFVDRVKRISGVTRIALIGSIATPKREPNDIDLLVTIATNTIARDIAAAGRKLKGHAQQLNRGADIFLTDPAGTYLGRTCPWRECAPGIRMSCEAQHCGTYLYDDLHVITLRPETIATPPLELWPKVVVRQEVPEDVREAFGIGG
ncbi:MAG TPA: UPF0158 family protein [Thermoanaerobaculia bacterium]|nr:UPF0158 family protein [Thermoanaerobaculia bacterium]